MHLAWKSIWSWKCQLKAFRWIQKPVCKRRSHESPRLVLYVRLYALGHRISCRHCQAARWRRGKSFSCKIFCHWTRRDREVASTRLLSLSDSTNPRTAPRKRSSGIRRAWTRILLRSAGLISDMITSNMAERKDAKIFIIKYLDTSFRIMKSCGRAVLDDRFGVQSDPPCTSFGF